MDNNSENHHQSSIHYADFRIFQSDAERRAAPVNNQFRNKDPNNQMEFRFNVNPFFKTDVVRVNSNLVPQGYAANDRRSLLDATSKMSEIINDLGEASARAQGLSRPVTTAQKLRNSDHSIYLMADKSGNNGSVVGMLKVGTKNLYVYDPNGETQTVKAPCILDFYIHESRQRSGLGKQLFETMLEYEKVHPSKMAIDRPSEKLLGFLGKHYDLQQTIPQANNFVIYDGFFTPSNQTQSANQQVEHQTQHKQQQMQKQSHQKQEVQQPQRESRMHITASPNTALFGPTVHMAESKRSIRSQQITPNNAPIVQSTPMGRFGAPKPLSSMAETLNYEQVYGISQSRSNIGEDAQKTKNPSKISVIEPSNTPQQGNLTDGSTNGTIPQSTLSNARMPSMGATEVTKTMGNQPMIRESIQQIQQVIPSKKQSVDYQQCQQTLPQHQIFSEARTQSSQSIRSQKQTMDPIKMEPTQAMIRESIQRVQQMKPSEKQVIGHQQCQRAPPQHQTFSQIIHNGPTRISGEPNSSDFLDDFYLTTTSELESYKHFDPHSIENIERHVVIVPEPEITVVDHVKLDEYIEQLKIDEENEEKSLEKEVTFDVQVEPENYNVEPITHLNSVPVKKQPPNHFQYTKQHTGLKNISFNVGAAVSPTDKMEFDQMEPESFGVLKINRPIGKHIELNDPLNLNTGHHQHDADALTDQGYFDLKFYHNKLW